MRDEFDMVCKNYDSEECPKRCTFWDCKEFKPSEYFMSGIKELKKPKEGNK